MAEEDAQKSPFKELDMAGTIGLVRRPSLILTGDDS
jgi:hypothetical protein